MCVLSGSGCIADTEHCPGSFCRFFKLNFYVELKQLAEFVYIYHWSVSYLPRIVLVDVLSLWMSLHKLRCWYLVSAIIVGSLQCQCRRRFPLAPPGSFVLEFLVFLSKSLRESSEIFHCFSKDLGTLLWSSGSLSLLEIDSFFFQDLHKLF